MKSFLISRSPSLQQIQFLFIFFRIKSPLVNRGAILITTSLHTNNFEMPSYIHDLPSCQSNLDLTGLPFLSEYDIDKNVPNTINSRYFIVSELAPLDSSNIQLSTLHCKIQSLSRHSDELVQFCADAKKSFDIIGASEIGSSEQNKIQTNVDVSGYRFYDTSSTSQIDGVAPYVKTAGNSRNFHDLNVNFNRFDTIWVEIDSKNSKNLFFCCLSNIQEVILRRLFHILD